MVLLVYTCQLCSWRFTLDLEEKLDIMNRPKDNTTILYNHCVTEHCFRGTREEFSVFSHFVSSLP